MWDTDADGDGYYDGQDSHIYDPSLWADWDNDGLNEEDEVTWGTDSANSDTDGDGLLDGEEISYGTDPLYVDTDSDGLTDYEELAIYTGSIQGHQLSPTNPHSISPIYQDYVMVDSTDTDGDGIPNRVENFYAPVMNPMNATDASGDLDADGVSNLQEYLNGTLFDGNLTTYDFDQDGMTDIQENYWRSVYPGSLNKYWFDDAVHDFDGDGVLNFEEVLLGLDIGYSESRGMPDLEWANSINGTSWSAQPLQEGDRDGDGMPDLWEHYYRLNLRNAADAAADEDADGLNNLAEYRFGSSPLLTNTHGAELDAEHAYDQAIPPDTVQGQGTMYNPTGAVADLNTGTGFRNFNLVDEFSSEAPETNYEYTYLYNVKTWYSEHNDESTSGDYHMYMDDNENLVTSGYFSSPEDEDPGPDVVIDCGCLGFGGCSCEAGGTYWLDGVEYDSVSVCYCGEPVEPPEWSKSKVTIVVLCDPPLPDGAAPLSKTFVVEQEGVDGWYQVGSSFNVIIDSFNAGSVTTDYAPRGKKRRVRLVQEEGVQDSSHSLSISDMSGPRYRKIGLTGQPIPDGKPQEQDESGQQPEETYVDAYTRQLRHSVTDIYASVESSLLPLSVRRDVSPEAYSNTSGLRPDERPDLPFGSGWRSNLCSYIHISNRNKASVIDENGTGQSYVRYFGTWQRDYKEDADAKTRFDLLSEVPNGQFILNKKFGTTCVYQKLDFKQTVSDDRIHGSETGTINEYARLISVTDRWDNTLIYEYPHAHALTPSKIYDTKRPDLKITIRQVGNLVTEVRAPDGATTCYHYASVSHGDVSLNSLFGATPVLIGVSHVASGAAGSGGYVVPSGGGSIYNQLPLGSARYYYDTRTEIDQNPGSQTKYSHIQLTEIEDETWTATSHGNRYSFDYVPNHTSQFKSNGVWRTQYGLPMFISQITLPDNQEVIFTGARLIKVEQNQLSSPYVLVRTEVSGPAGVYEYSFEQPEIYRPAGDPTRTADPGQVIYLGFMQMRLTTKVNPNLPTDIPQTPKTETFTFNRYAAMALDSVTDMSGKQTLFWYDSKCETAIKRLVKFDLTQGGLESLSYYYDDPVAESGPLGSGKSYTYGPYQILKSIRDEMGVLTEYTIDGLGRRTSETISGPFQGIRTTSYFYEDTTFPGFVTKTVTDGSSLDGAPETTVIHVPDANGRVRQTKTIGINSAILSSVETAYDGQGRKRSVKDGRGLITNFAYDARGRLTDVTHPDGSTKSLSYDDHGNLVKEVNENGVATFHDYDEFNRRISTTVDMNGNNEADTRYTLVTLPEDPEDEPVYNGDLVSSMTYTPRGQVQTSTDPRGKITTNTYDNLGRLLSVDDGGLETIYGYDDERFGGSIFDSSRFKPSSVTDPRGTTATLELDDLYRTVAKSVAGISGETSTTYDFASNPLTVTDPLGQVTRFDYDLHGQVVKTTYADGSESRVAYTHSGKPWKTVNELGAETVIQYDEAGRPIREIQPAIAGVSGVTETSYDLAGNAVKVKDALGRSVISQYDARNRPYRVTYPPVWNAITGGLANPIVETEYDDCGQVTLKRDALGHEQRMYYDAAGRVWKTVDALGHAVLTAYDAGGNVLAVSQKVTNSSGQLVDQVVTNSYDLHNRLVETVDGEGITNEFEYDSVGNRTLVRDGLGQETSFTYDALNRLLTQTFKKDLAQTGDDDTWTYIYNAVHKTSQTDANGEITDYTYDDRSRLLTVSVGGDLLRSFNYDNAGRLLSVTEAGHPEADVSYTYDALNRVKEETSRGVTHTYGYDLCGNRILAELGHGRTIQTVPDALNRPELILEFASQAGLASGPVDARLTRYAYDLAGRATVLISANGQVSENVHDPLGRLTNRTLFQGIGNRTDSGVLAEFGWTYNEVGNVTEQHETWPGTSLRSTGTRATAMAYDLANRLTSESVSESGSSFTTQTSYSYDAANNRLTKTVTGGTDPGHWTYEYNDGNQLTSWMKRAQVGGKPRKAVVIDYDANGNRIQGESTTYTVSQNQASLTQQGVTYQATTSGENGEDLSVSLHADEPGQELGVQMSGGHASVTLATDMGLPDSLSHQGITYATPEAHIPGHEVGVTLIADAPDQTPGVTVLGNEVAVTLETDSGDAASAVDQSITYSARSVGPIGNDIRVHIEKAALNDQDSLTTSGSDLTLKLRTDAGTPDTLSNQGITYTTKAAHEEGREVAVRLISEPAQDAEEVEVDGDNVLVYLATTDGAPAEAESQGIHFQAKLPGRQGDEVKIHYDVWYPYTDPPAPAEAYVYDRDIFVNLEVEESGSPAVLTLNGLRYEARAMGAEGNGLTVRHVMGEEENQPTTAELVNGEVVVHLGTTSIRPAEGWLGPLRITAVDNTEAGNGIKLAVQGAESPGQGLEVWEDSQGLRVRLGSNEFGEVISSWQDVAAAIQGYWYHRVNVEVGESAFEWATGASTTLSGGGVDFAVNATGWDIAGALVSNPETNELLWVVEADGSEPWIESGVTAGGVTPTVLTQADEIVTLLNANASVMELLEVSGGGSAVIERGTVQLATGGDGFSIESHADDIVALLTDEDSPTKDLITVTGGGQTILEPLTRTALTGGVERAIETTASEVIAMLADHPLITVSGGGSNKLQTRELQLSGGGENFLVKTKADEVVDWLTETNSPARNLMTVTGGGTHALEALPRTALSGGRVHQSTTQASELVTLLQNTSSVSSVMNVSGGGEHALTPMAQTHLRGVTSSTSLSTTYTWTTENRLAGVTRSDAKSYGYTYDYRIRRVGTVSEESGQAAKHTAILFSGGLSVAEYEGSTLQTQITTPTVNTVSYVRGPDMGGGVGGLLYSTRTETGGERKVRYNLSNGRGDIVAQSDESATLTWTASYEAYGKRPTETGENLDKQRANSKDEDPTGLLNEGFRYRDIETGVWLSRDPAGFVDGPNLYAYVMQNPWTAWDPLGLEVPKNRKEARQKIKDINDTTTELKKVSKVAVDKFGSKEGDQALTASARLNQALGYMLAELSVYQDYADKDGNLINPASRVQAPILGFDADTTAARRFAGMGDAVSVGLRDMNFDYAETAMAVGGARSLVSLIEAGGAKLLSKLTANGVLGPRKKQLFSNLYPEDVPVSLTRKELYFDGNKWRFNSVTGKPLTPNGSYTYVVQDGKIYISRRTLAQGGHVDVSRGSPFEYGGQIKFGNGNSAGPIDNWNNASGHFKPPASASWQAVDAGLPRALFQAQ
ncbi:RHS repeat-associated core domain-containing protein [Prosthecobacter debontii]|uniref:RHS repeat-associated core domain-containing protein n=1 Tax=Prosthecobacter debontii TaxID=48467 RepID=UPI001C376337|nr:RHS repeat-associated core domain-containing protein [Prosthecobacter debontii]